MDSATDTSGSSLSTPPYTDSNSDVDIDDSSEECRKSKEAQGSSVEGASSSTAPSHGLNEEGTVYHATKGSRIEGDESVILKPQLTFQDEQPTSESGTPRTESELAILNAKLLITEAHPTITQPATAVSEPIGPSQHSPEEADLLVEKQDDRYEAKVAGAVPSYKPLQNLSKKLQSSLASDQHPPQEPESSNLKRGSLHIRGGNRLSEVEQLQIWTIKNSEPVRSRRTLALQ
ncbi:hypothetical protein BG000_011804 [Podila horticola]|nr:hypothetical protein BG000_011804 [Podila horticola]